MRSRRPIWARHVTRCAATGCWRRRSRSCASQTSSASGGRFGRTKKVKPKSLQVFSRQFATMIEAGLSVVTALVILAQQTDDQALAVGDRGRARAGRVGRAAVGGDGEPSGDVQPALHRDGRGRRGCRRPRRRARPRCDADREGAEDQAARQGRDDLPVGRDDVRDARDVRNADVPRPGLREDLRPAGRRPADADAVRPEGVQRVARLLVHHLPGLVGLVIWGFFRWKKTEAGRQAWDRFKLRMPMSIGTVVARSRWPGSRGRCRR